MADTVVVRTYSNEVEARIDAAALEAHEIDCMILADNAGGALPAMSMLFPIRLVVHRSELDRARRVLEGVPGEADTGDSA